MTLKKLYDPVITGRPMRVMVLMSGTGTNAAKLIEFQTRSKVKAGSVFEVVGIFSDRSDGKCSGEKIAWKAGIPYFSYDIRKFHRIRGIRRSISTEEGLRARKEYDSVLKKLLDVFEVDISVLCGYMSFTTINRAVNVHPADLSIVDEEGKRKYTGARAIRKGLLDGLSTFRSSVIWIDEGINSGPILTRSGPVSIVVPDEVDLNDFIKGKNRGVLRDAEIMTQQALKEKGDWIILPQTVQWIAEGRFALDDEGNVFFEGQPVPEGVTVER